jgi:hypothetical protein
MEDVTGAGRTQSRDVYVVCRQTRQHQVIRDHAPHVEPQRPTTVQRNRFRPGHLLQRDGRRRLGEPLVDEIRRVAGVEILVPQFGADPVTARSDARSDCRDKIGRVGRER